MAAQGVRPYLRLPTFRKVRFLSTAAMALVMSTCARGGGTIQPELVWERAFDGNVLGAGVDENCLVSSEGRMDPCLRWVLLGTSLCYLDGKAASPPRPTGTYADFRSASPNGKYLISWEKRRSRWVLYDLHGRRMWEKAGIHGLPLVRDDRSSVFVYGEEGFREVRFLSSSGSEVGLCQNNLEDPKNLMAHSITDDFFAMALAAEDGSYEISLFDNAGKLIWCRPGIRGRPAPERDETPDVHPGGVAVSDHGEVLFLFDRGSPHGTQVHVYDADGELQDSLFMYPTGTLWGIRAAGRQVFISTGWTQYGRSHFLCYDLEQKKLEFELEAADGCFFGHFDVDVGAGVLAVAVHSREEHSVALYTLDGCSIGEFRADVWFPEYFWLKLFDRSVLTAEKRELRFHTFKVE